jgi:hypothetical protein
MSLYYLNEFYAFDFYLMQKSKRETDWITQYLAVQTHNG